jgi:aminotransferase
MALSTHPSKRLSELARSTPGAIDLTVGEPFYGPPRSALARLRAEIEARGEGPWPYTDAAGHPSLRRAIASYVARRTGVEVDPDREVLVTIGAAGALSLAVFTLTAPGDEVLLADPTYMLYERIVLAHGRRPVRIRTSPARGFALAAADVLSAIGPRSRVLVVNSPENPTGAALDTQAMRALVDLTSARGLVLVHDEVLDFARLHGAHVSALSVAAGARNGVLSVNSCSKRFGVTGWRVGWMVGPPPILREATKAHTLFSLACPSPLQVALAEPLADPSVDRELSEKARELDAGAAIATSAWESAGFRPAQATSSVPYYRLFDATAAYRVIQGDPALRRRYGGDDGEGAAGDVVANALFDQFKVAVVPGSAFGAGGRDFVRVTFAGDVGALTEAASRIRRGFGGA